MLIVQRVEVVEKVSVTTDQNPCLIPTPPIYGTNNLFDNDSDNQQLLETSKSISSAGDSEPVND